MKPSDQSRQNSVFERLRSGIMAGALQGGARLPPSRLLAGELGVARQTVVLVYERLAAEGYVRARVGSGTFVATDLPDAVPESGRAAAVSGPVMGAALSRRGSAMANVPVSAAGVVADGSLLLAPGVPSSDSFPAAAWGRCSARALKGFDGAAYPDLQGLPALRQAVASHLLATRGLIAETEQIVITAGTQQALRVAGELLLDPGDVAWVEEPGYIAGRGALLAAGARLVPVPADADGLDVAAGVRLAGQARLALVAPSHATPLGGALPIGRRLALLDWAGQAGAWVLEDDCDAEFRWEGKPLPPLAALDRGGRVIYCGSFSKTLAPGLRLGFAVVPRPLTASFVRARGLGDRGPGSLQQAALAEFIGAGLLGPHVRRMRTEYARRRSALLDALRRHCRWATALAAPGGLHLVLRLDDGVDEARVVVAARARGLAVSPFAAYFCGASAFPGLVVGFATTPTALAGEAARRLAASIRAA